jgi:hypothetical protein
MQREEVDNQIHSNLQDIMEASIHCHLKLSSNVSFLLPIKNLDDMDTVYFAYCYPFTYSDLCELIKKVCTY